MSEYNQHTKHNYLESLETQEQIDVMNQLDRLQVDIDNSNLQFDLQMWNNFRELHQKYQSYRSTRNRIPQYWNKVLHNSGILRFIGTTPTDDKILTYLKDIFLSSFTQTIVPDVSVADKKRLRVGFKIVFEFKKNEWFEETELTKEIRYVYNDTLHYAYIINSGVTFYEGKNPKIIDGTDESFFDFFEPINQHDEFSSEDDDDEIDEIVDDQYENMISFSTDIILNSLYYYKQIMDPYELDSDDDDFGDSELDEEEESDDIEDDD